MSERLQDHSSFLSSAEKRKDRFCSCLFRGVNSDEMENLKLPWIALIYRLWSVLLHLKRKIGD
jgi:hypothetical protein